MSGDMTATSWVEWWGKERGIRAVNWRANMEYFLRESQDIFDFEPSDIVLDIGCGPGYLPAMIKDRVREVHCLDTSARYVRECRERFASCDNVFTYQLSPSNYTDLQVVAHRSFTKIVCHSVVQYYASMDEVEQLLRAIREISAPGAQCLITDIPVEKETVRDTLGYLRQSAREGYLLEAVKLILRGMLRGGYARAYADLKLLVIDMEQLYRTARPLVKGWRVVEKPLTLNMRRKHLLLTF